MSIAADPGLVVQVQAAFNAGDFETVERLAAPSFASGTVDVRIAELLAAVRMRQARFADACNLYRVLAEAAPDNAAIAFNRGYAAYKLGLADEAVVACERAVALDETHADAHFLLGMLYPGSGKPADLQRAQDSLGRAVALRPDSFDAHYHYGRVLLYSSRETEAEAALRRALEIDPASALAHEELGTALLELGRVEEAAAELERAHQLDPQSTSIASQLERLRTRRRSARQKIARYPRSSREFADLDGIIEKYILPEFAEAVPFLSLQSRVFTLGSCFAQNIANALRGYGVQTAVVPYPEEINNTYANLKLLQWVTGDPTCDPKAFESLGGPEFRSQLRDAIAGSQAVIISLGVAPTFFDRETGEFALTYGSNLSVALASSKYVFRTTTVAENVANLKEMVAILQGLAPSARIILTVSPVPLKATFERASAIVADCASKSTLRAAANELATDVPSLIYWPSFEIVRWLSGHSSPAFGVDDDSAFHVSQSLIEKIMYAFIRVFATPDLRTVADAKIA